MQSLGGCREVLIEYEEKNAKARKYKKGKARTQVKHDCQTRNQETTTVKLIMKTRKYEHESTR